MKTASPVIKPLANLKPNPDWASLPLFDRTGWRRVRFGDVVENCNETCDPAEAGLNRFVAMEHLEPGSLHVRSWGNVADGTTFTRRCRPGQVLFGKRRAYQRKVAVAEFEAVVSGDIYVLAPKVAQASSLRGHRQDAYATLLPELLPFLCLSERFFQHAVGTSAGSLSPRTNWSSLASFEFDLPPLDQQRRIAEILWAVDEALETTRILGETLAQHLKSKIIEVMREHVLTVDGQRGSGTLGDVFDERRETGFGDLRILAVTISGTVVTRESLERSVIDRTGTEKYLRVLPGDIAYNTMRMWQGSCGVVGEEGIISPAYTVLIPKGEKADPVFWNYAFHTSELLDWFRRFSTGVASDRWRLYYRSFAKIPARIPSLKFQIESVETFAQSERAIAAAQANASKLWEILQSATDAFSQPPVI